VRGDLRQFLVRERCLDAPIETQALRYLKSPTTLDQRPWVVEQQVVQVGTVVTGCTPQFKNVPEPARGDQRSFRARAFDHHVRGHCRSVAKE